MPAPKDPVARALWIERMSAARTGEKNCNYKKTMSEGTRRKISITRKERGCSAGKNNPMYNVHLVGELNPQFGIPRTEEQKRKQSIAMKTKVPWNKGIPALWLKDIPRTEEVKQKISNSHKGKPKSNEHKEKMRIIKLQTSPTGENSPLWKGGITKLNLHIRVLPRYKNICKSLMEEKNYTDHFKNIRGKLLACHHIIPQNTLIKRYNITNIDEARECPQLFDKTNLIVMLSSAHDKFHNLYGDDKNIFELTPEQIHELYI
jgi:hypothetical protein